MFKQINRNNVTMALVCGIVLGLEGAAAATLEVSGAISSSTAGGVSIGAGSYTISQLSNVGTQIGTVSADGFTGVSLWGLLGGNAAGMSL